MSAMLIAGNGYQIRYSGNRLADVLVDGSAIISVQVRDYDYAKGEFGPEPDEATVEKTVREFLDGHGGYERYI